MGNQPSKLSETAFNKASSMILFSNYVNSISRIFSFSLKETTDIRTFFLISFKKMMIRQYAFHELVIQPIRTDQHSEIIVSWFSTSIVLKGVKIGDVFFTKKDTEIVQTLTSSPTVNDLIIKIARIIVPSMFDMISYTSVPNMCEEEEREFNPLFSSIPIIIPQRNQKRNLELIENTDDSNQPNKRRKTL